MKSEWLIQQEKIRRSEAGPGDEALRLAVRRWRRRPQVKDGPIEAIILSDLGRIRDQLEQLEQIILVRLFIGLDDHFNEEELRSLCFNLSVEYDNLPVSGRQARIRELITYLQRRGRIGDLVETYHRLRPSGRL
jgi:hypothetical protein